MSVAADNHVAMGAGTFYEDTYIELWPVTDQDITVEGVQGQTVLDYSNFSGDRVMRKS